MFEIYKDKKVLVTGSRGFKGSWGVLWLRMLNATVIEYGHAPNTNPNHYSLLGGLEQKNKEDLLEIDKVNKILEESKPDLVIHLAARAIVARTFDEPRETFENNIMGAVNILETVRQCPSVKGIVMITTDKVYFDENWQWGYRENDKLGGYDPYSASKVCIEHIIECYRKSYGLNIATARVGNVIGGGDWSYKRLIPDIVRATNKGEKVIIHTPNATRPWQHVLEPLKGYLMLGQRILEGGDVNNAWNFGPEGEMTVLEVLQLAKAEWPKIDWEIDDTPTHPYMVYLLKIDSTKSRKELGWTPTWGMEMAVRKTIRWYRNYYENNIILSNDNITEYERWNER